MKDWSSKKFLIVDDDPDILEALVSIIAKKNVQRFLQPQMEEKLFKSLLNMMSILLLPMFACPLRVVFNY